MKKLLAAMFVALLMVGCGEDTKKPAGDSPESNQTSAESPPAKTAEVGGIDFAEKPMAFSGTLARCVHQSCEDGLPPY